LTVSYMKAELLDGAASFKSVQALRRVRQPAATRRPDLCVPTGVCPHEESDDVVIGGPEKRWWPLKISVVLYRVLAELSRSSTFFKDVFVLGISDGQRSPGPGTDHKLKAHGTWRSGDEGNCAVGVFASGYLGFPLAQIKDRRSA
jgi:hypothetical protein